MLTVLEAQQQAVWGSLVRSRALELHTALPHLNTLQLLPCRETLACEGEYSQSYESPLPTSKIYPCFPRLALGHSCQGQCNNENSTLRKVRDI